MKKMESFDSERHTASSEITWAKSNVRRSQTSKFPLIQWNTNKKLGMMGIPTC